MMAGLEFDLAELMPHSGKMLLLDRILNISDRSLSAELQVRGDGMLLGDQLTVPAWAGMEYMAQAIAAFAGIKARQSGAPIRPGLLLGSRCFRSNTPSLAVGAMLTVTVEQIFQDAQLGAFECRIQSENIQIDASLNVYQPPFPIQPGRRDDA